jgi:CheY-like chemotaxis protein
MRPAKRILVLCADEELHSRLVVVLESKLYRVLRAHGADEAIAILARERLVDLVLAELPPAKDVTIGELAVFEAARSFHPEVKILARSKDQAAADHRADVWLPHAAGIADMLERIHVLLARKRGPKPVGVTSERERRMA